MDIVYHRDFQKVYASDPAARAGRMEAILRELAGDHRFVEPEPTLEEQLRAVHSQSHIDAVKSDSVLYRVACLSSGGAIRAAELAMEGAPSFALIRPPGHHASSGHSWGFCFFNNVAVALACLRDEGRIRRAFILDFDLHFGDGTADIFAGTGIAYFQPGSGRREVLLEEIRQKLRAERGYEILAVSAGFDRHEADWGGELTTDDYRVIGSLAKEASQTVCRGRRFGVLEGGYNYDVLGKNVKAFLEGFA